MLTHPRPDAAARSVDLVASEGDSSARIRQWGAHYIVGRGYDACFFLLAPIVSVLLGALIARWPQANESFWIGARRTTPTLLVLGAIVHAHLVAVVVRSHLNVAVFRTHRIRFTVIPLVVFALMFLSDTAMVVATVLVVFWDVYHSALQTFGLARFYDRLEGNDPNRGRLLDMAFNLVLYIGPILSGASLSAHLQKLELFEGTPLATLADLPAVLLTHQPEVATWVWFVTALVVVGYAGAQFYLWRKGNVISIPKVFLLTTTGACSLYVWANNPWGMAFFIMNLFHATQYLALVWWKERSVLIQRTGGLRREVSAVDPEGSRPTRGASIRALVLFLSVAFGYGVCAEIVSDEQRLLWCVTQTVALMHFYYDGFIWSVRKQPATCTQPSSTI